MAVGPRPDLAPLASSPALRTPGLLRLLLHRKGFAGGQGRAITGSVKPVPGERYPRRAGAGSAGEGAGRGGAALTDAQPHHHASRQQRLLVAGGGQHAGARREEAAGQQDAGPPAAQPVQDAAGQGGQGGGAHRAGDEQLLPERVQVELPLEEEQRPRHHAGVVAEEEAPQGGEDRHHVDEAGGLVLLELAPRRPLQLCARRRAVEAGAGLGGDEAPLARRRARAGGPVRLPPPLFAHQVAQAP